MNEQRCVAPGCGKRNEDGERQPRIADRGALCDRCYERYCDYLGDLIDLYVQLPDLLDPDTAERTVTTDKISRNGPIASPAGARLDVIALLDKRTTWDGEGLMDVLGVLESWTRMVREERGMAPGGFATITTEVNFLSAHAQWTAAQPWMDELYGEVRQVWDQLRQATGRGPDPVLGYCGKSDGDGECGGAIRQVPGQLTLTCGRCRETWQTAQEVARARLMMSA